MHIYTWAYGITNQLHTFSKNFQETIGLAYAKTLHLQHISFEAKVSNVYNKHCYLHSLQKFLKNSFSCINMRRHQHTLT